MTPVNNLKCPHCNSHITLSSPLGVESSAQIHCEHCQERIVVKHSSASDALAVNDVSTAKDKTTKADKILGHDILIHDDMDIYDFSDPMTEYESLDGMNAWVKGLDSDLFPCTDGLINNSHDQSMNEHSADPKTSLHHAHARPPTHMMISSAEANDIHASVAEDSTDLAHENAWLERLLQEESTNVDTVSTFMNDHEDTDFAQQLKNLSLPTLDTEENTQARVNRIQARMQDSTVIGAQHTMTTISTVFWGMGSGLLILILLTQYIIFNIDTLAKNPAAAQRLQAICAVMPCTIPSADIDAFTITKPKVSASQLKNEKIFSDIQATLLNGSTQTQLLPNLKVSIYSQNTIIGEFVAEPSDYLTSRETKLAAERRKSIMFTVPITAKKISKVVIESFY